LETKLGKRITEIDALRGIAVLGVILAHYTDKYDREHHLTRSLGFDVPYGYYGVYLFFVISGFVIHMTLHRCETGLDFAVSRFSRIFPAYWAALLITFGALHALGAAEAPSVFQTLLGFTMLERFFGVPHLDTVYWTLNVELSFYLWMLLVFKLGWLFKIERVIPFVLLFQALAEIYAQIRGAPFPQSTNAVFLLEYGHLFCAGMIFYLVWQRGLTRWSLFLLAWCLMNQTIVRFREFAYMPSDQVNDVATALVFLIIYLTVKGRLRWLATPVLLYLGTISYTLYLLHNAIGTALMERLTSFGLARWPVFALTVACLVALASLVTYAIEKPAMAWIRRFYRQRERKREGLGSPMNEATAK
jgi:peptidoglycan/LPS O-acetylase OafA/YrhL